MLYRKNEHLVEPNITNDISGIFKSQKKKRRNENFPKTL